MKSRLTWAVVALCVSGALIFASWAQSKAPTQAARSDHLASQVRCPTCQGLSVAESTSPLAMASRDEINRRLSEGESDKQIRAYFVSRYGDTALMTPDKHGFALVAWIAPAVLGLLAVIAVVFTIRRWSRRAPPLGESAESAESAESVEDRMEMVDLRPETPQVRPVKGRTPVLVAVGIAVFVVIAGFGVTNASHNKDPKDPQSMLLKAQQLTSQGKAAAALKEYDAVLKKDPANANALAYRGWLIRLAGLPDQGLASIDKAIAVNPAYADAYFFRGIILLRDQNKPKEAIPELQRFLNTNPPEETRSLVEQALQDAKTQAK